MREFSSGRVNLNSQRTFDITLDQGETHYHAEVDTIGHTQTNSSLSFDIFWVIGGQEIFHRRVGRIGQSPAPLDRDGNPYTLMTVEGRINSAAEGVKVYVQTTRPLQSDVLVRLLP